MFLHRAVKDKDDKMRALIKCLTITVEPETLVKIHSMMQKPWGLEDHTIIPECSKVEQNTVRFSRKFHTKHHSKTLMHPPLSRVNSNQILFDE